MWAQVYLAIMYNNRYSDERDIAYAYMCFSAAAAEGNGYAIDQRAALDRCMSRFYCRGFRATSVQHELGQYSAYVRFRIWVKPDRRAAGTGSS